VVLCNYDINKKGTDNNHLR